MSEVQLFAAQKEKLRPGSQHHRFGTGKSTWLDHSCILVGKMTVEWGGEVLEGDKFHPQQATELGNFGQVALALESRMQEGSCATSLRGSKKPLRPGMCPGREAVTVKPEGDPKMSEMPAL